jgi:hypothetical protein
MPLKFYVISVAVFLLGGFCLYLCIRNALPGKMSTKTVNRVSLAMCSGLALGGVSLATFAFFYV